MAVSLVILLKMAVVWLVITEEEEECLYLPVQWKLGLFSRLFAIGCQLSPEPRSSGIELLETDTFKLHCHQTMTGG